MKNSLLDILFSLTDFLDNPEIIIINDNSKDKSLYISNYLFIMKVLMIILEKFLQFKDNKY